MAPKKKEKNVFFSGPSFRQMLFWLDGFSLLFVLRVLSANKKRLFR